MDFPCAWVLFTFISARFFYLGIFPCIIFFFFFLFFSTSPPPPSPFYWSLPKRCQFLWSPSDAITSQVQMKVDTHKWNALFMRLGKRLTTKQQAIVVSVTRLCTGAMFVYADKYRNMNLWFASQSHTQLKKLWN